MSEITVNTRAVYNSIADQYAESVEDLFAPAVREDFVSRIPKGGKVLDVGCAAGRDSRYFDSIGFEVVGVDFSDKLLDIAKEKAPGIQFVQQDVRDLQFPDASFDGIYASAVLLHLKREEVKPVLEKFYAMLKPNGILGIQVKEGEGEGVVKETLSDGKARYFMYFGKEEVENMVKQAGFSLHKTFRYNEKDINPTWRDLFWISCLAYKR